MPPHPSPPAHRFRPAVEPLDPRLTPAVHFRFDYSFDTSGFFANPDAQAALQRAADHVTAGLQDSLAAITPGGGNSWQAVFLNPITDVNVRLNNLSIGADEILVFVAAAPLPGSTIGVTGSSSAVPRGSSAWANTVRNRGQAAAPADYSPWGAMVAFDSTARWDYSTSGPAANRLDFESVAIHELVHVLGFGISTPSFERYDAAAGFVGPTTQAVAGGPVPLDGGGDHWAADTTSAGQEAAMTPSVPRGSRKLLTPLDRAALVDIGWTYDVPPTALPVSPPPPTVPVGTGPVRVAVGAGEGGGAAVTLLDGTGSAVATVDAFPDGSPGGVRVATADFDGDDVPDVVVGTGPRVPARVRVLSGEDGRELFAFSPFEDTFTGGVFVAAGDVTGDGVPDLIVSPDDSGGPRVRVLSGAGFAQVADFFGIDDLTFRGGARVAVGDVNRDGVGDLIVAAGTGGGPRVGGYDGRSVAAGRPVPLFADFFAFDPGLRNGVYVAAGDTDGDGYAEVIAGAGPGGGPRVTAWSGRTLATAGRLSVRTDFFAGDEVGRGGVRVAAVDLNGDRRADLVVGAGGGIGSAVTGYSATHLSATGAPPAAFDYTVYPGFFGGVFVG